MRHPEWSMLRRMGLVGTIVVVTLGGLVFVAVHAGLGGALLNSGLTAGAVVVVVAVVLVKVILLVMGGHRLRNHRSRSGAKRE